MGDIVSDVIALYEQLNARPIAQAIWFVDRPGAYFRLRYYLQETLQHEASSPPDVDFTPICAMRLPRCGCISVAPQKRASALQLC